MEYHISTDMNNNLTDKETVNRIMNIFGIELLNTVKQSKTSFRLSFTDKFKGEDGRIVYTDYIVEALEHIIRELTSKGFKISYYKACYGKDVSHELHVSYEIDALRTMS